MRAGDGDQPLICEIHTWAWLDELSRHAGRSLSLADVPVSAWERLRSLGFDSVWLMGVWERSPTGIAIARAHVGLALDFRRALPDLRAEDVVGSPYSIHRYVVDPRLGGASGLAAAREALRRAGLRLLLDFVPNHVGRDHAWVLAHPEFFVHGSADDLARVPDDFFDSGQHVIACARDPFYPPWTDVAQLDLFAPDLRAALTEVLIEIAAQCDGVRCDMAMLVLNTVFARTWGARVGPALPTEFWPDVIAAVRARRPGFLFVAEAYWDLEPVLLEQGFDLVYDKRLYDRLRGGDAPGVRAHIAAVADHDRKLLRFLENHDEARAAEAFSRESLRAAALALFTLPGAKLVHEGQLEGRRVRLPVQLGRRPEEPVDRELAGFYAQLLALTRAAVFQQGQWQSCVCAGWPDNATFESLLAWCWCLGSEYRLVIVNLAAHESQGRVRVPRGELVGRHLQLNDLLSGEGYERDGDELTAAGLYVNLPAWGGHLFAFRST